MKAKTNIKQGLRMAWSPFSFPIKGFILGAFILTGIQGAVQAQSDSIVKPSWWFGVAGGANVNFYNGYTQQLNSDVTTLSAFHAGNGVGLYLAPLVEFHRPDSRWGIMMQAGYDSRQGKFDQEKTPCNCPADLSTKLSYITVEPSLRFTPFKSNFYIYAGPRLAFNLNKSFTYKQGVDPANPNQAATPDVKGDFSKINKTIISMQVGAGYDINLSSESNQSKYVLSPFVSFHPYFGQDPRSIETLNLTTLRLGVALKFGQGHKVSVAKKEVLAVVPQVQFSVYAPSNIPTERRVREIFPLRNYVFFDNRSTDIPHRYVLLTKDQVKDFKEDQLEVVMPKKLSGRSDRQMIVYYNILNIVSDRMGKNPSATITLSGSSMKGAADGKAMAESIKKYLVVVFGITPSRIVTEGQVKPNVPSEQPGGKKELKLLREGDRRVSIESNSPALLMEFQSGPGTFLKPVAITAVQKAPVDSYVSFTVEGAEIALKSWSLEIKDDAGVIQKFGPYTQEIVKMPGKSILGNRSEGNFKVTMIGKTKSGLTVRKEALVHMVLWTAPKDEQGIRYSVIFEINKSDAIAIYDKYLTEVVTPSIPVGATVIIHGHTDIIGEEDYNQKLSQARANEVKSTIENALTKVGRKDVKFEVYGLGEDENLSPFENKYPEERFYNRAVIIDIIIKK